MMVSKAVPDTLIPVSEQRYVAEHNTILRATVGSKLHGLNIDGWDDDDEMGICIEPPEYILGLRNFEQWVYRTQPEGVRSGPGDLDLTIYGLKKYCSLAAKGNPSILCLLFVPPEMCSVIFPLAAHLRGVREKFISKMAIRKFLGYMTSQKEKLLGERGGMRVKRPELIEQFGYDTKYAMHALRLGFQGIQLGKSGEISYPIPEPMRTQLIHTRKGLFSLEEIVETYEELVKILEETLQDTDLPQDPDWYGINQFMMAAYLSHWENNVKLDQARKAFGVISEKIPKETGSYRGRTILPR